MSSISSSPARLRALLLSPAARPLRFAGTGGTAGAVQLLLLAVMTRHGWNPVAANGVAFLLAAQLNFALSWTLTWRDRYPDGRRFASLGRSWLLFHGSIAFMALVNMLTFALARSFLPTLAASMAGIAAGAAGNYFAGDRLVFRRPTNSPTTPDERRSAA